MLATTREQERDRFLTRPIHARDSHTPVTNEERGEKDVHQTGRV